MTDTPSQDTAQPTPLEQLAATEAEDDGRGWMFYAVAGVVGTMAACLLIFGLAVVVGVLSRDTAAMANFVAVSRDLLVILLVLQGLVIGVGLLVVIFQVACLLNILQNEIEPVVDGLQETSQTARGTATFISRHVTEPVIKGYAMWRGASRFASEVSGVQELIDLYHKSAGSAPFSTGTKDEGEAEPPTDDSPPGQNETPDV